LEDFVWLDGGNVGQVLLAEVLAGVPLALRGFWGAQLLQA
jgi:hypothetical protein